ncbi:MAG: MEDS domain-containing protein [Spirochaetales bacterium]|nr:MEDS domain-containing protein [Spirochaetales bacterium]
MYLHTSNQEKMELGFGGHVCHWGTHIAGLYETEEERDLIMEGFLRRGLEAEDVQRYCLDEEIDSRIRKRMVAKNPSLAGKINDSERMALYSPRDLYYPDGTFSPERMQQGLTAVYEEGKFKHSGKIRAFAEMSWAVNNIPGLEELMLYEAGLNEFVEDKPWVSICLYDLTKFSGEVIMEVFRTHPYVINKGVITENPFFVPPDQWLRDRKKTG